MKRSGQRDPVPPELHAAVWARDGECIGRRILVGHECWGHRSVDHVWWIAGGKWSKRAPSRLEHLVAMCNGLNVSGPSRDVRQAERDRLRELYPSHGTEIGCLCDD